METADDNHPLRCQHHDVVIVTQFDTRMLANHQFAWKIVLTILVNVKQQLTRSILMEAAVIANLMACTKK
jgi:hypothetical protein